MEELYCGFEEHAHNEECCEKVLICGYEEILSLPGDMEVENTCVKTHTANNGEIHTLPRSTKPDAGNHGFGTANVRDTAAKYGGLLYIEQNGKRFIAILTIAKSCLAMSNGQET